ncbi:MAG TPA: branched-chain amino acid ABC transporter ATP-binding protein/permease, partial [Dehalococcoidia bacterium]|nr:branched-chain amino acid ABC transporter ATP-binding protein/permease [Dehalococcoidia bacterium]
VGGSWSSVHRKPLFLANQLMLYMLVAIGLNLISGYVGAASIGHIALYAIGAYTVAILTVNHGWGFWPALLAGGLIAAAASLPVGLILLRLSGWYFSVITLLLVVVVNDLEIQRAGLTGGGAGIFGLTMPALFGVALDLRGYLYLLVAINVAAFLLLRHLVERSRWGRAFVAVRDVEPAACAVGVHPFLVRESALAISAFIAGIAGGLFAPLPGTINPDSFPIIDSIFFLLAVLAGGFGTVAGPVVGMAVLFSLPQILAEQGSLRRYSFLVYGLALLLLVIFLPEGIVGGVQRLWRRLTGRASYDAYEVAAAESGADADRDVRVAAAGIGALASLALPRPLAAGLRRLAFSGARAGAGTVVARAATAAAADPVAGSATLVAAAPAADGLAGSATANGAPGADTGSANLALATALLGGRDGAVAEFALEAEGIHKSFGDAVALDGVTLRVRPGTVHAVIGPNGSGKTTLLNIASGFYRQDAGQIRVFGRRLARGRPYRAIRHGLARTFQTQQLLPELSVLENVMLGCHARGHVWMLDGMLPLPHVRHERRRFERTARDCLDLVGLGSAIAETPAGLLPFAHQRLVEIARALAGRPRVLLLDEPASGLHAGEVRAFAALVRSLRQAGLTVVLVEHNFGLVSELADTITVLDAGAVLAEGDFATVRNDPHVVEAYLGA